MTEFNPFAGFKFKVGDIVRQRANKTLFLVVLTRSLTETPGLSIEREYYVRGGSGLERFEGVLCEIEMEAVAGQHHHQQEAIMTSPSTAPEATSDLIIEAKARQR